jgi:hypothetical protein
MRPLHEQYEMLPTVAEVGNEIHYAMARRVTERNAVAFDAAGRPIMTDRCAICNEVAESSSSSWSSLSRINGDSRWGFEPYHLDCAI